jgi:DNA modification methylase
MNRRNRSITRLSDLTPDDRNPNIGTERGQQLLENSLRKYGAGRSILIDKKGRITAGNKTFEQAGAIGLEDVLVVQTDGKKIVAVQRMDLDLKRDKAARELAIADNRVQEIDLSWNPEVLASLNSDLDLNQFWTEGELSKIIGAPEIDEGPEPQLDRAEELRRKYGVKRGQIWEIGRHRLMCGVFPSDWKFSTPDVVFTDPPYGMNLKADFSGEKSNLRMLTQKGLRGGRKYKPIIGDLGTFDPTAIFSAFEKCREMFLWGADYYSDKIPERESGSWFVWDKRIDESADKMYGSAFELCWSRRKHKREIARVKWAGVFGTEKEPDKKRFHPAQKPVALSVWFLQRFSRKGMINADPFSGVGGTIIAADRLDMACKAMECEAEYVAVSLQRLADMGLRPKLVKS